MVKKRKKSRQDDEDAEICQDVDSFFQSEQSSDPQDSEIEEQHEDERTRKPPDPSSMPNSSGGELDHHKGDSSNQTNRPGKTISIKRAIRPLNNGADSVLAQLGEFGQAARKRVKSILKKRNVSAILQFILFYRKIQITYQQSQLWSSLFVAMESQIRNSTKDAELRILLQDLEVRVRSFLRTGDLLQIWLIGKCQINDKTALSSNDNLSEMFATRNLRTRLRSRQGQEKYKQNYSKKLQAKLELSKKVNRNDRIDKFQDHYKKCKQNSTRWMLKHRHLLPNYQQ